MNHSGQTPHFIRQGTSREKFCNDASRLDEFRKTFLAPPENDEKQEEAAPPATVFALAKAAIENIEARVPSKEDAQAFIDGVFEATLSNSGLTPEVADFFEVRTVKYDDIYVKGYETVSELHHGLKRFFEKYNARKHQGLAGLSPQEKYRSTQPIKVAA